MPIFDEVSDFILGYKSYGYARSENEMSSKAYKYYTIITFWAISAHYLLAYSALLKIRLDQRDYEPEQTNKDSRFGKFKKLTFLTFVGPLLVL